MHEISGEMMAALEISFFVFFCVALALVFAFSLVTLIWMFCR